MTGPTRVLTFSGTVADFLDYMDRVRLDWALAWSPADEREAFDWEVTASIVRHPAGKGLGVIEGLHDSNADGFWGP